MHSFELLLFCVLICHNVWMIDYCLMSRPRTSSVIYKQQQLLYSFIVGDKMKCRLFLLRQPRTAIILWLQANSKCIHSTLMYCQIIIGLSMGTSDNDNLSTFLRWHFVFAGAYFTIYLFCLIYAIRFQSVLSQSSICALKFNVSSTGCYDDGNRW
jgi:hypothetical protein